MSNQKSVDQAKMSLLTPIPNKIYFTIGEVSRLCRLKPHVLRYWEQEFRQLTPTKRRGNRRYYQRKDVKLVRHIRELLYDKGYTIEGARQQLESHQSSDMKHDSMYNSLLFTIYELERIENSLKS